jgi:hypothetical protein
VGHRWRRTYTVAGSGATRRPGVDALRGEWFHRVPPAARLDKEAHLPGSLSGSARIALAGIRIANGALGLFAPAVLSKRLDVGASAGPMSYPFRMFGIRTILIGADLLSHDEAVRRHALRAAVVVHASDTAGAVLAGRSGALPPRAARTATAISAANLVLALLAGRQARGR